MVGDLGKLAQDLLGILKEAPKARDVRGLDLPHLPPLSLVKARAEGAEGSGADAAPEPTQPSSSTPLPSASPAAAAVPAAPAAPSPPAAKLPVSPPTPPAKPELPATHGRRDSASGRGLTDTLFSPVLPNGPPGSPAAAPAPGH